jgi:small subunit ribosomal protein S4e
MTHYKRLPAPKHYPINRKGVTYISKIKGSRSSEDALPTLLFLREVTGYADTKKEAKEIIRQGHVLRNGERLGSIREGIGILDVVELPETEEAYRVIKTTNGMKFVPVTDKDKVAAKITGKKAEGDEYVYGLHNGENLRTDKEYTTGNTLIMNNSVTEVELEEGAKVLVIGGAHAGETAEVEEIVGRGMNPDTAKVSTGFETRLENLVAVSDLQVEN